MNEGAVLNSTIPMATSVASHWHHLHLQEILLGFGCVEHLMQLCPSHRYCWLWLAFSCHREHTEHCDAEYSKKKRSAWAFERNYIAAAAEHHCS